MKKWMARLALTLGLMCLGLGIMLSGFEWATASGDAYWNLQKRLETPLVSEFPEAVRAADWVCADYLFARRDDLALDGETQAALGGFTQREIDHMVDVRALFALERQVCRWAMAGAVALIALGWALARGRRGEEAVRACRRCAFLWAGLLVVGALAVAVDFESAFLTFHHLLFTNDLWLLSAQDLLIRLYPESFFAGMALRIGVFMLGGLVLVYLAVGLLARKIAGRFDRGGNPNAV